MGRFLSGAARGWGGVMFVALFGVFMFQVVSRFVFNHPLPWTDELAVVLYVWIILWACATMVPAHEHVMFDLLWQRATPDVRRWMAIAGHVMVGGLCLWALPACWDYVWFMSRESTPVLDIPFSVVFMPFVVLLVSLVVRALLGLRRAWRGEGLNDTPDPGVPS